MTFLKKIKVAWLLATTRIKRTSFLATGLIVLVMTLTFLNLLVVRGILIGLPKGAVVANEDRYYSDVYISAKTGKKHITENDIIENEIEKIEGVDVYTNRYITSATLKADFDERIRDDETPNQVITSVLGINIKNEAAIIGLKEVLEEGRMFESDSEDNVIIGSDLLADSDIGEATGSDTLTNVGIGSDIELTINGITKKVNVVGITKSKVSELDRRIIVSQKLFKKFVDRDDYKPDEIVIKAKSGYSPISIREELLSKGLTKYANIETAEEYQPTFVEDLVQTFSVLGNLIGAISLVVAAITVFIIIFVNALTQRKSIGILKGIGISPVSIEISYILQALFYVLMGGTVSIPLVYSVLVPYFKANPIDFPFSDGILVVENASTFYRVAIMLITTGFAGFLPAKYIVKKNTLDSILGR